MSMFEDEHYRWRETYFVLFDAKKRPNQEKMKKVLSGLSDRYQMANFTADSHGLFESGTVLSPDDFAALDVCYVGGDEVQEQVAQLVAEMQLTLLEPDDQQKLQRIARSTGRFDVLHFEQLTEGDSEEEDEMLDPSAMLVVLSALAKLTDGIAVDPQSGTMM
jgi:hypothetical protein